jgi:neutral ceramidase
MRHRNSGRLGRRQFLRGALATGAAAAAYGANSAWGRAAGQFEAGEGVVDTTPPLQIELAGFHVAEGQPGRLITGIRQPAAARALVLRVGDAVAAVVSVDIAIVSAEMAARVRGRVQEATGIPADHVRICATHTHSMPAFQFLRQWGAVPRDYMAAVEQRIVDAVRLAKEDLAPAELSVGTARAAGGNFNRTAAKWKTDADYTAAATDDERWLDTAVHVLRFDRAGGKRGILWYHFSAHPVCFTDTLAGPDWPGMVHDLVQASEGIAPAFLQGHAGDVNPGDGQPWIGDPNKTAPAVHKAIREANAAAKPVKVDALVVKTGEVGVALDVALLKDQLERYRTDPAACASGEWVDAGFAKSWYEAASKWDVSKATYPTGVSAMRLGELGWVFHPAELFSYYGLAVRHRSPLPHTLVVGYADGIIGYLADPNRYKENGYEASVVPKILDIPPFTPTAARTFTDDVVKLANACFA